MSSDKSYYVSDGRGNVRKVSGWFIMSVLGGFAKLARRGWTFVEDSGKK